ncbi:MAG TPA: aspartate aminotransferase family protein, partial [Hyalangium sp.]|nr:aspartate aminotransferase family protein [Hyalangium sp.]
MALPDLDLLSYVPPRILAVAERYLKAIPLVRNRLDQETGSMLAELEGSLKPYKDQVPTFERLPAQGRPQEEVLRELEQLEAREQGRWKEGRVSGAVYHGAEGHIAFVNRVYSLHSQSNPLHADLWPSATKFEAEVVAMTASMLGAEEANAGKSSEEHICGSLSSGGTESIMLAMKTYRDQAHATRRITRPEMVA